MPEYHSRQERRKGKQSKKRPNKKKKGGLVKRIILTLVVLFVLFIISGTIAVAVIVHNAPPLKAADLKTPISTKIYFSDGSLMTSVGTQNRTYAPINKVPNIVKEAFISTEDTRFYSHFGIDPYRIGGAILANLRHGFGAQGASTITQQVIKNDTHNSQKTITRKIQEAYLAIKLEQEYSKDQILEMYLNTIYLGDRSYGVATAAQDYFGLNVNHLSKISLAQAAMLAALPKAPSYYDPTRNPQAALDRRNLVLDLMVKNKAITQAQADAAKKVSIADMLKKGSNSDQPKRSYDSVVDLIESHYVGTGKQISKDDFYQGGLKIHTTIDKGVQNTIENVLNNDNNFKGAKPNFEAGIATINTQTGAILGIGGGRHYTNGTNWALSGDTFNGTGHQVGSTAKPLVDYGPAIEYLKWPTTHIVSDEPYKYAGTDQTVGEWDGKYWGAITMERALIWSRNVPAVKTLHTLDQKFGPTKIINYDKQLGIHFNPKKFVESYAIGSFTANPLEIAGAYAAYGNNGVYNAPHVIASINYPDGRQVKLDHDQHVAFHDYTAYMVTDMLKGVTQTPTTYHGPSLSGYPVVGKSGSTNVSPALAKMYNLSSYSVANGNVDEWFTGYSPKITTSVWTGYVPPKPGDSKSGVVLMGSDTAIAGQLFGDVMTKVASKSTPYWNMPNSVVRASVEKSTGLLASQSTPSKDVTTGLFVKGTAPTQVSTKYQKINPVTNLKATYNQTDNTVQLAWDYKVLQQSTSPSSSSGSTSGQNSTNGQTGSSSSKATQNSSAQNISFEINQKTDTGYQPIGTSKQNSFIINNVQPGTTYNFQVIAVYTNPNDASKNKLSDPVKVQIVIPALTPGQTTPGTNAPGTSPGSGTSPSSTPGNGTGTGGTSGTGSSNNPGGTSPGTSPTSPGTGGGSSPSTSGNSGGSSTGTSSNSQSSTLSFSSNPMGLDQPKTATPKK